MTQTQTQTHTLNVYNQNFYQMLPEQVEYVLYSAIESVLAIGSVDAAFPNYTKKDTEVIDRQSDMEGTLNYWDELSEGFQKQIIQQAIEESFEYGFDSGINNTYSELDLKQIESFWKQERLTADDIKRHIERLSYLEQIEK